MESRGEIRASARIGYAAFSLFEQQGDRRIRR